MNCSKCNTTNENDNLFCVSCGETLARAAAAAAGGDANMPPTVVGANPFQPPPTYYMPQQPNHNSDAPDSVPTHFGNSRQYNQSLPNFNPGISYPGTQPQQQKSSAKFIWVGALVFLLLAGGGAAIFFINKPSASREILPDHLGMFVQNREKNAVSEISKQDFSSALAAKDELVKNDALPTVEGKPNLILYSDGKDVPLMDLKLVQLDTIKDDGTLKQLNYQPQPVEGKPEMKRLRVPDGLANGKYAFALFGEFMDEGKHRFWAFQVKDAERSDNGDSAKAMTLAMKPKSAPTANTKQVNASLPPPQQQQQQQPPSIPKPPPSSSGTAYSRTNNVVLRSAPSLSASKVSGLYRGQKLYIINYSDNYDTWRGTTANWAYVATDAGQRGWVFTPLIGY